MHLTNGALNIGFVFVLGAIGLIGACILFLRQLQTPEYVSLQIVSPAPTKPPTSTSFLPKEFPPLYADFEWKAPIEGTYSFITRAGKTTQLKGYRIESELLTSYPQYFIGYYRSELPTRGWVEIFATGRGMPTFVGFEKDKYLLIVGINSSSETGYHAYVQYAAQEDVMTNSK
jgi:hypothetical protein